MAAPVANPPPVASAGTELALQFGNALCEEGLRGEKTEAARKALLLHLSGLLEGGDAFEGLLLPERDLLVIAFLEGFGRPLGAAQLEDLRKLIAEERAYLDLIRREPPDVPWIERARLFTSQACEWDRRLDSILDPEQKAALRSGDGGLFDYKDVPLVRSDPKTNCERVNFSKDPTGERLARKWCRDLLGPDQNESRFRTYATEYARLMLEIGVPYSDNEARASLAYRKRQLEIHASVQKMMLEDRRFSEEELAKIRGWSEMYEGDR